MVTLLHFICVSTCFLLLKPVLSQHFYDETECTTDLQVPGSNYLCNSNRYACQTFIIYRAQPKFNSVSAISSLFQLNQTQLITLNKLTESTSNDIPQNRELIVPISCSCSGNFSQAVFNYTYNNSTRSAFPTVACEVFEGLLKAQTLLVQNPNFKGNRSQSVNISVPVRCACPDNSQRRNGVKYLVTYPIFESDNTTYISGKFGIDEEVILAANGLEPTPTIYPLTTLLIPTKEMPVLKLVISPPADPSLDPRPFTPLEKITPSPKGRNSNMVLGLGVSVAILLLVVLLVLFIYLRRRWHVESFQPLSAGSSKLSNFSSDFLDGMSKLKHSLLNFTIEDLQLATEDFSESMAIGSSVHHGRIEGLHIAIELMASEDAAHQVVDILTKINHLNIIRLEGFCYDTRPYLVSEFAAKGSLRNCLSDAKVARELTWIKRMQIAFDLAVGLHYIHHCTSPSYVHRNINSRTVLISIDWRAKISGFKWAKPHTSDEKKTEKSKLCESLIVGRKGYLAPEYIYNGLASLKVDVFAFGVVLLELMSAKEAVMQGCMLKEFIGFLVEGALEGSTGCLEKLKDFMDPSLEGNYPLGNALCLALLAKGCLEDDPNHRPTMNDVLKALSRIL